MCVSSMFQVFKPKSEEDDPLAFEDDGKCISPSPEN